MPHATPAWTPSAMNVPWTESPFFPRLLADSGLSPADRELVTGFAKNGYAVLTLDPPPADLLRDMCDRSPCPDALRRHQDAWRDDGRVVRLATHPQVERVLRLLYRREPIPFQTLNFRHGTEQRTHSDAVHFYTYPPRFMCGAWVALEDMDADNGPLHLYPGSHRLPLFDMHDFGLPASADAYPAYEAAVGALADALGLRKVALTPKAGQVVVWAANMLHGGEPIRDRRRTRHSQVTHYVFEGCLFYTPLLSEPMAGRVRMRNVVDVRTGKPVAQTYRGRVQPLSPEQEFWAEPSLRAFVRAVARRSWRAGQHRLKRLLD